jgi:hypothetical protein
LPQVNHAPDYSLATLGNAREAALTVFSAMHMEFAASHQDVAPQSGRAGHRGLGLDDILQCAESGNRPGLQSGCR